MPSQQLQSFGVRHLATNYYHSLFLQVPYLGGIARSCAEVGHIHEQTTLTVLDDRFWRHAMYSAAVTFDTHICP